MLQIPDGAVVCKMQALTGTPDVRLDFAALGSLSVRPQVHTAPPFPVSITGILIAVRTEDLRTIAFSMAHPSAVPSLQPK
jgi:hypothetical protein